MANDNYLTFDTDSIKELINDTIDKGGNFSDQLYDGSNLSVMVDVFSAMYSTLVYQLNVNATESIFTDAQFYSSINRLVKILGYNPHGILTSQFLGTVDLKTDIKNVLTTSFQNGIVTLPRYTTLTSKLNDEDGNPVKFSLVSDFSIFSRGKNSGITLLEDYTVIDSDNKPTFYNGEWIYYDTPLVSTGGIFETFILAGIPDDTKVAYPFVHVYIEDTTGKYTQYNPVINLYNSTNTDTHFEVRVNENKQYEIKFGDAIHGQRLSTGDKIHIIYLRSNGKDGEIYKNFLKDDNQHSLGLSIVGLSEVFIKDKILDLDTHNEYITYGNDVAGDELSKLCVKNLTASSEIHDFETVEEIRENAPNSNRMGNRVITHQDFKQYISTNFKSNVLDIFVQNNYEYMAEFQYWLDKFDKLQVGVRMFDYSFADSCDFNNIYLWMRSRNESQSNSSEVNYALDNETLKRIESELSDKKPITAELMFPKPFEKLFTPCLVDNNYTIAEFNDISENGTGYPENMFIIYRDRNTLITEASIIDKVESIIKDYFSIYNTQLGMVVNPSVIHDRIMAVTGIKDIKTRFWTTKDRELGDISKQHWYDGLSFACWTPAIIEGADLSIVSGPLSLKNFQFPIIKDKDFIKSYIEVVSSKYTIAEIEY